MILDTDVLIWYMRENENAIALIASAGQPKISQVSWLELIQGVRNKRDLAETMSLFEDFNMTVLPLTGKIGTIAGELLRKHALKDGLNLADSLIAATAIANGMTLATANHKHFKALGVKLKVLAP